MCLLFGIWASTSAAQDPETVRIADTRCLGSAPAILADRLGFFRNNGLDVRLTDMDSGKQALGELRDERSDFALMALTPVVIDRLADPTPAAADDPVILASLVHSADLMHIIALPESGISSASGLRGRRIGLNPGTSAEYAWWLFRQFHGLPDDAVEIVEGSNAELAEALIDRRIGAAMLLEPWVSVVDADRAGRGQPPLTHLHLRHIYASNWVLVTRRDMVDSRPEHVRRVVAALRDAVEFIERAPARALWIYQDAIGESLPDLESRWNAHDFDLTLDWKIVSGLQQQFRWALESGYRNQGEPLRVLDSIDDRVLRRHWPASVGIPEIIPTGALR